MKLLPIYRHMRENDETLKHDGSYYDQSGKKIANDIEFKKYGVDDELTIYYTSNVQRDTIKDFLRHFNSARKKIESKFKMKLGRQYKDPDASYKIWFGKNVVLDNKPHDSQRTFDDSYHNPVGEFVRGDASHSPGDSFYFNLGKTDDVVADANKNWQKDPSYKKLTLRTANINSIEKLITHELAHAVYFQQPLSVRNKWKQYYDDGGWENATSMYGQENDMELFAETIVDIIDGEEHQITKDLIGIFGFQ